MIPENETKDKEAGDKIEVNTPHDKFVKRFLRENETVRSFFREYLPPVVIELLDVDTLEFVPDSFVDNVMGKFVSDFLYKVKFKNRMDGFVFLLLDHKSWLARFVSFQALKYIVRIWDDYLANNKNAAYLPPVIPLVLYHGKGKWKLKTRFSALFNKPGPMKAFIPEFKYLMLDISHSPDTKIKGIPVLKILLMTLKYIFKPTLKNKLREIFKLFREIKDNESAVDYLETLVIYLMSSAGKMEKKEIEVPVSEVFEQGGEIMATIAEKLKNEGKIEGKIEGKWDVVKNLLREGLSIDIISKGTGFTAGQINEFKQKMQGQLLSAAA
jgi:predicted transposase/invertase (TIGR01784 family)